MSLFRILYTSRSTPLAGEATMSNAEIEQLAAHASRANTYRGVTGALLHVDGSFIQVLEGERDTLEELFEVIACDTRHSDVSVLIFAPVSESLFPNWSMTFVASEDFMANSRMRVALAEIKHAAEANGAQVLAQIQQLFQTDHRALVGGVSEA